MIRVGGWVVLMWWVWVVVGGCWVGVVVGVPLAMLVGRALTSSLYGVKPLDATSYLLAVVGVAVVALLASAVPAGRAASINPLTALRTE